MRGYGPSRFSFNTAGGRCEACEGQGVQTIEMSFLPDVKVPCDVLRRAAVQRRDAVRDVSRPSIGDVLAMSVDDAVEFFAAHRRIHALTAPAAGRRARLPDARTAESDALGRRGAAHQAGHRARATASEPTAPLYVLDEPTVGLHMADVEKLLGVLHRLVEAGNTVVVIEHNLDVIAEADWVIDLGPEGGSGGGRVVVQGPPERLARATGKSHTARFLAPFLVQRGR